MSALFLISQCYLLILNNEKCGMERKIGLETIRNFEKSEDDKIEFRKLQSMASIKNQVIWIISFKTSLDFNYVKPCFDLVQL